MCMALWLCVYRSPRNFSLTLKTPWINDLMLHCSYFLIDLPPSFCYVICVDNFIPHFQSYHWCQQKFLQVSVYPIYSDPSFRYDTTLPNSISCLNVAYSAAAKPRPSAEKTYIKIFLSTLTQLLLVLPFL